MTKETLPRVITVKNAEGDPDTKATIIKEAKIDYEPKVSVIIPVYNTEEYLRECLDSVVNQTLKEIEIICVDDGSTDTSLEILREYAEKDNRFTIITQENLHAGVARNAGLAVAKGEYVHIFDSDDFVDTAIYKKLYKKAKENKADLCIFDVNFYDLKTKSIYKEKYTLKKEFIPNKKIFSKLDIPDYIFTLTPSWAWNKFIRKDFLKNQKIYFQNTIHSNDVYFAYTTLALSQKIIIEDIPYIFHRENVPTGLTSCNIRQTYPLIMLDVIEKIDKKLKKENIYNILERSFIHGILSILMYNLNRLQGNSYLKLNTNIKKLVLKKYCLQKKEKEFYFYPHIQNFVNSYLSKNEKCENRKEKNLYKLIEQYDIISFDLFDTLILRPYICPKDVFKHVEQYTKREGFYKTRVKAEENAKKVFNKKNVTYDEIYSIIPEFSDLKEIEKDIEISTIYCNQKAKKYYDYALKLEKKIIFTTDMYFSKDILDKILKKNGLNKYDFMFISSEINKSKQDGELFDYISLALNEKKSNFLHIGDNVHSDINKAKDKGIKSYCLKKPIDELCNKNIQFYAFRENNKDDLTTSIILGLLLKKYINDVKLDKNYWEYLGYVYGGPLCYAITKFLLNKAKDFNIKDLIFVARDGYTIEKIFKLFKSTIKTHYIVAPRVINMIVNQDYQDHLAWTERTDSFINILPYYCKDLKKDCQKLKDKSDKLNFINNNKTSIQTASEQAINNYMQYINNFSINSNNIALFDVASSGFSSLKLLQKTLRKNILGLFFQSAAKPQDDINFLTYKNNQTDGFLHVYELLEFLVTAPEYPVLYINNNGFIRLKTLREYKRINKYKKILTSEINFSKDLKDTFSKYLPDFDCKTIISFINSFSDNLTVSDIKNFKNIKFLYNEEHKKSKRIIDCNKKIIPIVYATNDTYAPYLSVSINSLIKNANKNYQYNIYVFHTDLKKEHIKFLESIIGENYSTKCLNVEKYITNVKLVEKYHFTKEMYYRFLIPEILEKFEKIIYIDCDTVILDDISVLYNQNIDKNILGAVINPSNNTNYKYKKEILGINYKEYFNSGVLIFNTTEFKKQKIKEKSFSLMKSAHKFVCPDQDILNIVCSKQVKFLDPSWNFLWHCSNENENLLEEYKNFYNNGQKPRIIHYTTGVKPWEYPNKKYAKFWWDYTKYSPYFKNSLVQNLFSIKNEPIRKQHKIITILGIKFKIKRKQAGGYSFVEKIFSIKNRESRDDKWYKVICILGLKFKYKNKELTQRRQLQALEARLNRVCDLTEQKYKQMDNKLEKILRICEALS